MSKYEPIRQTCKNCQYLDQSTILASYPAQAFCKYFNQTVFVNSEVCWEDMPNVKGEKE